MNRGTTDNCDGIIIVPTVIANSASRPRNCIFANAKPASGHRNTMLIATAAATMKLLRNARSKGNWLRIVWIRAAKFGPGRRTGGTAETTELSFEATTYIQ